MTFALIGIGVPVAMGVAVLRYRLYDAVTPQDIQTVAQKYFKPEAQTIVRLGPAMDGMPAEEQ